MEKRIEVEIVKPSPLKCEKCPCEGCDGSCGCDGCGVLPVIMEGSDAVVVNDVIYSTYTK